MVAHFTVFFEAEWMLNCLMALGHMPW